MYSGNPDPANDLKLVIEKKRAQPGLNCEIVSEASRWLKSELKGANVDFTYLSCEDDRHYGYSIFLVHQTSMIHQITLRIKIAEINEVPHVACEIQVDGDSNHNTFPFYHEMGSNNGKRLLLHYIADFALSGA